MNQLRSDRVDYALEGQNDSGGPQVHLDSADYTHGELGALKGAFGSF